MPCLLPPVDVREAGKEWAIVWACWMWQLVAAYAATLPRAQRLPSHQTLHADAPSRPCCPMRSYADSKQCPHLQVFMTMSKQTAKGGSMGACMHTCSPKGPACNSANSHSPAVQLAAPLTPAAKACAPTPSQVERTPLHEPRQPTPTTSSIHTKPLANTDLVRQDPEYAWARVELRRLLDLEDAWFNGEWAFSEIHDV